MEEHKSKKTFAREIILPDGVEALFSGGFLKIKGRKGDVERKIEWNIKVRIENSAIYLESGKGTQKDKKIIGSVEAHVKNMVRGVLDCHRYTLKICSGHFPMSVSASGNKVVVKNFLGEKVPRALEFSKNAKVTVEGDLVCVESPDKETAGQISAGIEQLTRRPGYDMRVFQDGIWIINKDGKEIK